MLYALVFEKAFDEKIHNERDNKADKSSNRLFVLPPK